MATLKQQRLVKNLPGNYKTKAELIRSAGYSENTALQPGRVMQAEGIKELMRLAEMKGFTDDECLNVVQKAIKGKDLTLAVQTVYKWWYLKYPQQRDSVDINVNNQTLNVKIDSPEVKAGYEYLKQEEFKKNGFIQVGDKELKEQ